MDKPFYLKMQNEGYVQIVEGVLADIRDYLISGIHDSLHDAEYKTATEDAQVLAAVMTVEMFVLNETPTF